MSGSALDVQQNIYCARPLREQTSGVKLSCEITHFWEYYDRPRVECFDILTWESGAGRVYGLLTCPSPKNDRQGYGNDQKGNEYCYASDEATLPLKIYNTELIIIINHN